MEETRKLLEQDKDRVLGRLSSAENQEQAAAVLDEEMGRLLVKAEESASSPKGARSLRRMLLAVRYALPMIDTAGEVRIYERRDFGSGKETGRNTTLLAAGAICLLAGIVILLLTAGPVMRLLSILGVALAAAGFVLAVLSGKPKGRSGKKKDPDRQIRVMPDAKGLYHKFSMTLASVDAMALEEENEEAAREEEMEDDNGPLGAEELRFFGELLELIYAEGAEGTSGEALASVRYYLHLRGVDLTDYDGTNEVLFDMMPSAVSGTLRPALVSDGKVLARGLAAP